MIEKDDMLWVELTVMFYSIHEVRFVQMESFDVIRDDTLSLSCRKSQITFDKFHKLSGEIISVIRRNL